MSLIWSRLNPEQRKMAVTLHKKWEAVARSTERINEKAATEAIKTAYSSRNKNTRISEILFFDSPRALQKVVPLYENAERKSFSLERRFQVDLVIRLRNNAMYQIEKLPKFDDTPNGFPNFGIRNMGQVALMSHVSIQFLAVRYAWLLDIAHSLLGCPHDLERWQALQLLIQNCGFLLPFNDICLVSDRPVELIFKDIENQLIIHAENRPAVVFKDGYEIFALDGVKV
jgi:hypothetical protein